MYPRFVNIARWGLPLFLLTCFFAAWWRLASGRGWTFLGIQDYATYIFGLLYLVPPEDTDYRSAVILVLVLFHVLLALAGHVLYGEPGRIVKTAAGLVFGMSLACISVMLAGVNPLSLPRYLAALNIAAAVFLLVMAGQSGRLALLNNVPLNLFVYAATVVFLQLNDLARLIYTITFQKIFLEISASIASTNDREMIAWLEQTTRNRIGWAEMLAPGIIAALAAIMAGVLFNMLAEALAARAGASDTEAEESRQ